jgi:glucose/arabinose dehydrogenase
MTGAQSVVHGIPTGAVMRVRRMAAVMIALGLAAGAPPAAGQAPADLPATTFGGRLRAPSGITVAEFARVPGARFMAVGPDGAVFVSQPRAGQVTRLVDADGDGVAETQTVAVSGLNRPHGLAVRNGWLYIANTDALVRVRLDASGEAGGAPERVASYVGGGGHWTRTVLFGADSAIYVSIGSSCNICEERSPERASVMRYDAGGGNGRVFASGLRNAVGMALHPTTGQIWVTQNERDNLQPDHQDLPPEEINLLRDGAHYGWPYCHGNRVPNPEFGDGGRCASTEPPALAMQAHSAPLGITFLAAATRLPAEMRGDALVAFHGSWNRDVPTGYKVVRIRVRDGRPVGYEDFLVGWLPGSGRPWGRPVDVAVHRDGSVLVSDDSGGMIYRVTGATR